MRASQEVTVVGHAYDLMIWSVRHVEKLPRTLRFGLGQRIETQLYDLLELLIEAKFSRTKTEVLRQAALRVEHLRFLFRACTDLRVLAMNSHQHACQQLDQIGREIGGWRKRMESQP